MERGGEWEGLERGMEERGKTKNKRIKGKTLINGTSLCNEVAVRHNSKA